jgi:hypothetical protein
MRIPAALAAPVLALMLGAPAAAPAAAQTYAAPSGPYRSHCRDIRMNGHFMSAVCQGTRGAGPSSINILSCSTPIFVDASGALSCVGPGGGKPPAPQAGPPGYALAPGAGERIERRDERRHERRDERRADRRDEHRWRSGGRAGYAILYARPGWRGRSVTVRGAEANLDGSGLNDHVRSIRIDPRAGPWLVCSDAGFRGDCRTIRRDVRDTRRIGMRREISSIGPAR